MALLFLSKVRVVSLACFAVAACMSLAGCGAVGDPMPPLLDIPQPPTALTAVQRGGRVIIGWPPAVRTTEGVAPRPDRLGPIKIYRVVFPDAKSTATLDDLKSATMVKELEPGKLNWEDPIDPAWVRHSVVYALKMTNRRGEAAGFSNIVVVQVQTVMPAPTIRASFSEKSIAIEWTPLTDTKYRVYRDGAPIGDIEGGQFSDPNFSFDHTYSYVVRTLSGNGTVTAESVDSNAVTVTPLDTFPPAIPQGLRAIVTEGVAEISWSPNRELDLAGYNVYRNGTKLNDKPMVSTVYRDATPGASPRYTVTSIDTHGNESKASEEVVP
jgi:hypothetical protein